MSAKLTVTKNYRLFELHPFNRDVTKIKMLRASMKKHGYIEAYPLHCIRNGNATLRIKAGHHRFVVAEELGLAVPYVVCNDDATIHELESATNPWKLKDFVMSFIRTESAEHATVLEFSERTGIGLSQAASLLGGESGTSGNLQKRLKDGTFVLSDPAYAEKVGDTIVRCREIGLAFATHRCFVGAMSLCCCLTEFDPKVFLHRLAINAGMAKPQPTVDSFLAMIEEVYNRQSRNKIALAFLAREAARNRAAVKPKEVKAK
jgi:hypothetical protein